jgi:hypothetical protein
MTIITNQKLSYQKIAETHYAGGDAGAARSLTKIAAGSTTTGMWCFKKGSSIVMPKITYNKVQMGGSLASNFKRYRHTDMINHRDGSTEHYLQDNSLITAALLTDGVNPSVSYVFHWEDGVTRYESYGCAIKEYQLNLSSKELPTQKCTWVCHNSKYETSTGTDVLSRSDVPLISTAFALRSNCSLTLASVTTMFESLQLKITNTMFEKEIENGLEHVVIAKDILVTFTSVETDTTRYNKDMEITIGDETLVITTGKFTLTLTHCDIIGKVDQESIMENGERKVNYEVFPTIQTEVTLS